MVDSDLIFEKNITIFSESSQFIFHKAGGPNEFVSFNKETMKVKNLQQYSPKIGTGISVYAVIGILNASTNYYLLGVNKATFIGYILNFTVFKIDELVFLSSVGNDNNNVIPEEDQKHIQMVKDFIKRNSLFYSEGLDLTARMQNLLSVTGNGVKHPNRRDSYIFNEETVPHYCWNYNMALELDALELKGFVPVVINGYVGIRTVSDYPQEFNYAIIARKDSRRSGMRFLVRGNDKNGSAANYVETEHILIEKTREDGRKINLLSYVQIRGSVPFLWTQSPNLQLNPKIQVRDDFQENASVFRKHMTEMRDNYGRVVLVNLIDKKRDQKMLGDYFLNLSKDLKENKTHPVKEIDFVWFDFHAECKGMKYQNLSRLIKGTTVSQALNQIDFFHVLIPGTLKLSGDLTILSSQKGVFRTNCIDCLDRTNVVQTIFSRISLHKMLNKLKISDGTTEDLQEFNPVFELTFKNVWADHGDFLSQAYSGTKALKSDYVRTGKRNVKGAIKDGIYTCNRFYINNFCDGYNQDCHDYFLRKINPKSMKLKEHSTNTVKIITPAAFLLVFALYHFLINIALPKDYEDNFRKQLLRLLIFLGVMFLTIRTVFTTLKKMIIDTGTNDYF